MELLICSHFQNFTEIANKLSNSDKINKEQCSDCFLEDTCQGGIDLCLECFNGGCTHADLGNNGQDGHSQSHFSKTKHNLVLNIKKEIHLSKRDSEEITKIGINVEGGGGDAFIELPKYVYLFKCLSCIVSFSPSSQEHINFVRSVEDRISSGLSEKVKAWELEILPCEHSRNLISNKPTPNINNNNNDNIKKLENQTKKCADCDLQTNLWICLTCGNLGCGRKYFDGTGGNSHGVGHYESTKHSVAVKLGTLGGKEEPSAYCYICNNDVKVENIKEVLKSFNIDVDKMRKTEKTINQMSLEVNLNFELSQAFEAKEQLSLLSQIDSKNYFWGIDNIGNSCYLNSCLQMLSVLRESFVKDILTNCSLDHPQLKDIYKMFHGLRRTSSGQLSLLSMGKENMKDYCYLPKPFQFRKMIAKDHPEFKTSRQQDAVEYLTHLLNQLSEFKASSVPAKDYFRTSTYNKLECTVCKHFYLRETESFSLKVEFRHDQIQKILAGNLDVSFTDLISNGLFNGDEVINCDFCKKKNIFDSSIFIKSLPENLLIFVKPFYFEGLTAKKLHYDLKYDTNCFDLSKLVLNDSIKVNIIRMINYSWRANKMLNHPIQE